MGRIVGDGFVQLFIADVIVHADWCGLGIGTKIVQLLMNGIRELDADGRFVGLFAAHGKEKFYEQFGFIARPNKVYGSGMMLPISK